MTDSDITRLASAIVDELERRKEERRVETAKERNADGCDGCARQLPEFWTGGMRFHRVSEDTWRVCATPRLVRNKSTPETAEFWRRAETDEQTNMPKLKQVGVIMPGDSEGE